MCVFLEMFSKGAFISQAFHRIVYGQSLPAGGEYSGSVGHLLCVCCGSDDEKGIESLNLCINDELSPLFISHHHILQLGKPSLSCQTLVPSTHTGMHMCLHVQKHRLLGACFEHTHTHTYTGLTS